MFLFVIRKRPYGQQNAATVETLVPRMFFVVVRELAYGQQKKTHGPRDYPHMWVVSRPLSTIRMVLMGRETTPGQR